MEDIKKETENIRLPWKATMKIKKTTLLPRQSPFD